MKLKCGIGEYLCFPGARTRRVNAIGKHFGGVNSMTLSTQKFEYALRMQSTKLISFHYARHPMS